MSHDLVFVEEYRKELQTTGYPFSRTQQIRTATGNTLPYGLIVDASVYYDNASSFPSLTGITKSRWFVTFHVGDYTTKLDLREPQEVLELSRPDSVFGGILVIDPDKTKFLKSWMDGHHAVSPAVLFCPRCMEFIPVNGLQRLRSDDGDIFSGDVVIVAGKGGIFQTNVASRGFVYMDVSFTGDPTYQIRSGDTAYVTPLQTIEIYSVDAYNENMSDPSVELVPVVLQPGDSGDVGFLPCNTEQGNMYDDALRIGTAGSTVNLTLMGQ